MRGNVEDVVVIGLIVFVSAITLLFSYLIVSEFSGATVITASPEASAVASSGLSAFVIMGNAFIFLVIGLGMASGISAFYTETHPVFFVFSIIMFAICMLPMVVMSDVFVEIASTGQMLPVATQFTLLVALMQDFPYLAVFLAAIIMLALYSKRTDIQRQGGMA